VTSLSAAPTDKKTNYKQSPTLQWQANSLEGGYNSFIRLELKMRGRGGGTQHERTKHSKSKGPNVFCSIDPVVYHKHKEFIRHCSF
jgi:hypothetical protein